MSLQRKIIWMPRDSGCLTDGEMSYDSSSRIEPERGQWFMEPNGSQGFNKKHAIEAANGRPVPQMNDSPAQWDTTSGFQSVPGQCNERLFGSEPMRAENLVERHIQSIGSGNMNMGRKGYDTLFGSNPSVGLSMSHTIEEDPSSGLSFGGIRKVKVNQVRDSEHIMTTPSGHAYCRVDNGSIDIGSSYGKSDNNNNISLGVRYNNGPEGSVSVASSFPKADESYILASNTFNKGGGDFISIGHSYSNGNNGMLSMGQCYNKGGRNIISVGQSYEKGDGNMSLSTSYNKGHEDFTSIGSSYEKSNESLSFIQMDPCYSKGNENIVSMAPSYKAESRVVQMGSSYDKGKPGNLSMGGQGYNKNESTTISFGGFHEEDETLASGGIISSYDLLMSNQNPSQYLEVSEQKNSVESNLDPILNSISKADNGPKYKEPKTAKKPPANNFPSNVKSLLSTGIFDGVPVKYVSWSRDKNLKGVIKGTGYLCSCAECNHTKSLNAYEYERHAGCKTKHPNNHIFFENGKTIYAVVQELKNTSQETLFDAIQNVTGSPINKKKFCIWKASYQAATRELQRIYGKDEMTFSS